MDQGDIIRRNGEHGGIYRVTEVLPNGDVSCFGGPLRQFRTFRPDMIRPGSAKDVTTYTLRDMQEADLRRAIRPARALRLNTRKAAS